MAATKNATKLNLTIELDSGKLDTKGNKLYSKKSFNYVKTDADIDKVMNTANAIISVLSVETGGIGLNETYVLSEE